MMIILGSLLLAGAIAAPLDVEYAPVSTTPTTETTTRYVESPRQLIFTWLLSRAPLPAIEEYMDIGIHLAPKDADKIKRVNEWSERWHISLKEGVERKRTKSPEVTPESRRESRRKAIELQTEIAKRLARVSKNVSEFTDLIKWMSEDPIISVDLVKPSEERKAVFIDRMISLSQEDFEAFMIIYAKVMMETARDFGIDKEEAAAIMNNFTEGQGSH